tara:strand:- start:282 stop:596 length:315 start_codon:yes stop_codon:yes gene_type:complete
MKLSEITKKPQLIEVLIDDKTTVKEYGEALSFHTWDRQPMDVFIKLANLSSNIENKNPNIGDMIGIVKTLILDEDGKEILTDENAMPTSILMKVIQKVTESLGK